MAIIVTNQGEASMLRNIVNLSASADPVLRLFTNNLTPTDTTSGGDFTEATGVGYAAITLTGVSWTVILSSPSDASFATATFTFTSGLGDVYGYYVTSGATVTGLKWCERFTSAPISITTSGSSISIIPKLVLTGQTT